MLLISQKRTGTFYTVEKLQMNHLVKRRHLKALPERKTLKIVLRESKSVIVTEKDILVHLHFTSEAVLSSQKIITLERVIHYQ